MKQKACESVLCQINIVKAFYECRHSNTGIQIQAFKYRHSNAGIQIQAFNKTQAIFNGSEQLQIA